MRPVATDVARSMVCVPVCLCVGHVGTAEPVKMPFAFHHTLEAKTQLL